MAEACRTMGMQYLGISDHSKIVVYANGLSADRLKKQGDEIRALNDEYSDFRIFHGTECDIMLDGTLDFSDDVLAELDFVVISVHQKLAMSQKEATDRIVKAMQNPHVTILGHPTGRILLEREGYPLDYDKILLLQAKTMSSSKSMPALIALIWIGAISARQRNMASSSASIRMRTARMDWLIYIGVLVSRVKAGCRLRMCSTQWTLGILPTFSRNQSIDFVE